jgi:hypothetical protein
MRSVITNVLHTIDSIGFRVVSAAHMVIAAYVVVALLTMGMDSARDQATTHHAQVQGGQQSTTHAPHTAAVQGETTGMSDSEGRCLAAALIFARMESGLPMYVDLTWRGVPDVVGQYHDDLRDAYSKRAHEDTIDQWVARYVGQCIASDWYEETGVDVQQLDVSPVASPYAGFLAVDYDRVPAALWDGLRDAGFSGVPNDGPGGVELERLYVPFGTVVDVPGGLYLVTVDGPMVCTDWVTAERECSATGPVVPLSVVA